MYASYLASRDELHIRKMKLDYQEVGECPTEVQALWEKKLNVPCRTKVQWDKDEIHTALCQGNCNITPTHIIIQKLLYQYLSISDFLLVRSTEINPLILYNLLCIHAHVWFCVKVSQNVGEVRCGCSSLSSIACVIVYLSGSSLLTRPTRTCSSSSPHSSMPSWWTWVLDMPHDL